MSQQASNKPKSQEERTFYAQIDSRFATQDYFPRQGCVRLIGVTPDSYEKSLFNTPEGCPTYVIDIGEHDVYPEWGRLRRVWLEGFYRPPYEDELPLKNRWVKLDYLISPDKTNSYAYAAFSNDEPNYISIQSISFEDGPVVDPLGVENGGEHELEESIHERAVTLTAFHVGQGMCSLIAGEKVGYLIDAGAGIPLNRENYRANTKANGLPLANDLRDRVSKLTTLSAIVSHPDIDHWRLLEWDAQLLAAVTRVYLPAGQPALAFSAPAIKPKVRGMIDRSFTLSSNSGLEVYRAEPAVSDKNGECLVAKAYSDGRDALLPGDYVYARMATDKRKDGAIANLASAQFDAVVVPHHGDEASANVSIKPRTKGDSIAYFSAGTHAYYRHPRNASLMAHDNHGFAVVAKQWCQDILALHLLP